MKKLIVLLAMMPALHFAQTSPLSTQCQTLISDGVYYANKNDWMNAMKRYSLAIEMCPENALAYHNRAIAKQNMEDYKSAAEDYAKAIQLNTNTREINGDSYYGLGMCLYVLGSKEKACTCFSKSGELGNATAYEAIKKCCH